MGECAHSEGGSGQTSCPKLQAQPSHQPLAWEWLCPGSPHCHCLFCLCLRGAVYPLPGCASGAGGGFGAHAGQHSYQRYLSGAAAPLLYLGRWVDGQDFPGLRLALLLVFISPWGYQTPALGLKFPGQRAQLQNVRQFGTKDTHVRPATSNSGIPSVFYPTPQHLSFRVLQSPDFTVRVPARCVNVCEFFLPHCLVQFLGLGFDKQTVTLIESR